MPILRSYTHESREIFGIFTDLDRMLHFDLPAGTQDGDELIFAMIIRHHESDAAAPVPDVGSRWTPGLQTVAYKDTTGDTPPQGVEAWAAVSTRTADHEPSSYTISGIQIASYLHVVCLAYLATAGTDSSNISSSESTTTLTADVATTADNDTYVAIALTADLVGGSHGALIPVFGGQTKILQAANHLTAVSMSEEPIPTPGALGTHIRTLTLPANKSGVAAAVSILAGPLYQSANVATTRLHRVGGGVQ